jgi:transcriptional regulator with XRE-family HTH domain
MLWSVRISREMSQTELATLSGVSQAVVSGIERGSVQASMEQEEALATALGVPPALLRQESVAPRVIAPFQRSLPARARNNILANLALSHFHVEQLMGHAAFELPYRERPSDPSRIASLVRLRWGIDDGPIPTWWKCWSDAGSSA